MPDTQDQPAGDGTQSPETPSMAREVGAVVALLLGVAWVTFAAAPRAEGTPMSVLVHPLVAAGLLFFLLPFRRRVACARGVLVVLAVIGAWLAARMSIVWAPFLGAFVLTYLLRFLSQELQTIRLPRGHVIRLSARAANNIILGGIVGLLALSVFVIIPGFVAQVVQLVDGARIAYVRGVLYQSADVLVSDIDAADGPIVLLADTVELGGDPSLAVGSAITPEVVGALKAAGVDTIPVQRPAYLIEMYENADWLVEFIEEGEESGGISGAIIADGKARLTDMATVLGSVFARVLDWTGQLLSGAVGFLATTVFTLIVLSYLIRSYDNYLGAALLLFPVTSWERVQHVARGVDQSLQAFLRGQFIIIIAIAFLSAAAYGLCGIPFALLMGVIGGLLNTIPNVGPALAGIVAAGALLVGAVTGMQPDILLFIEAPGIKGFFLRAALIPVAIFVVQAVDNAFISPRVMSRAVSIDPLMILGSVLLGGAVLGFWGVLLAIPGLVVAKAVWENWDAGSGVDAPPPPHHDSTERADGESDALDDLF